MQPQPLQPGRWINWPDDATARWGQSPLCFRHDFAGSGLFTPDALAELIDRHPVADSALVLTHRRDATAICWREGDRLGMGGRQVMKAIQAGHMWLNLRSVNHHDSRYHTLLQNAYAEISNAVPGFAPQALRMGVLISSPGAQVPYHADLPGQGLWQIAGRKRIWIYPPRPPFLTQQAIEDIAFAGLEFRIPYEPAFDAAATVIDLEPGQALSWPLNAPHRIANHDCLNVSVTTEYWTDHNRRSQQVHLGNAVLRHWGLASQGQALTGPSFWTKKALQAGWRRSPWGQRAQRQVRPIDFRLDPTRPGEVIDMPPHY